MIAPNEFWLALHTVTRAFQSEGDTHEQRGNEIIEQFLRMPDIAQREMLDDLSSISPKLAELYVQVLLAYDTKGAPSAPAKAD